MKIIKHNQNSLLPEIISFEAANVVHGGSERSVEVHICAPSGGINENTGLMLVSHNWGGTWEMCWNWCPILSDKFNLITIDTNYYQSAWKNTDPVAYDYGVIQAMDCLQALYEVRKYLDDNKIAFNRRRNYASGASGGGNISQMVNKFAPHTFGCIIDLCGMPGLTDDIAYNDHAILHANYSRDPNSSNYLTDSMKEIRDFGNLAHLAYQYSCNPDNQVVIVHGVDDDYCSCPEKARIFSNMLRAGFKPEGFFITPGMVDGIIVTNTEHSLGDRPYIIAKYGQRYIQETGEFIKQVAKDDFDRQSIIKYPVSDGTYQIDYTHNAPVITFERK